MTSDFWTDRKAIIIKEIHKTGSPKRQKSFRRVLSIFTECETQHEKEMEELRNQLTYLKCEVEK